MNKSILFLGLTLFACNISQEDKTQSKNDKEKQAINPPSKILTENQLPFISDPGTKSWGDFNDVRKNNSIKGAFAEEYFGVQIGEIIGLVVNVGEFQQSFESGKRIVNNHIDPQHPIIRIPYNFSRPNCSTNPNRTTTFSITLDIPLDRIFENKPIYIIGQVKDLRAEPSTHACEDASFHIYLEKTSVEKTDKIAPIEPPKKIPFSTYKFKNLSKKDISDIKNSLSKLWNKQQSHGQLIPDGKRDIENLKISYGICLEVINYMSERTLRGAPSNDLGACLQSFTWSYQVNSSAREIESWINSFSKSYAFEDSDKEINLKFWRNAISQLTSEFNEYSDEELATWVIESGKY